jgi:hypothetical protein
MATFQFSWWRKTLGAFHALFQAQMGTGVEPLTYRKLAGWLTHMKKIQSTSRDLDPQQGGASCLISMTLTTRLLTALWFF